MNNYNTQFKMLICVINDTYKILRDTFHTILNIIIFNLVVSIYY